MRGAGEGALGRVDHQLDRRTHRGERLAHHHELPLATTAAPTAARRSPPGPPARRRRMRAPRAPAPPRRRRAGAPRPRPAGRAAARSRAARAVSGDGAGAAAGRAAGAGSPRCGQRDRGDRRGHSAVPPGDEGGHDRLRRSPSISRRHRRARGRGRRAVRRRRRRPSVVCRAPAAVAVVVAAIVASVVVDERAGHGVAVARPLVERAVVVGRARRGDGAPEVVSPGRWPRTGRSRAAQRPVGRALCPAHVREAALEATLRSRRCQRGHGGPPAPVAPAGGRGCSARRPPRPPRCRPRRPRSAPSFVLPPRRDPVGSTVGGAALRGRRPALQGSSRAG